MGVAPGSSAWASDPFPVQETFREPAFGSQWRHGGSAELTGTREAEGWLRLTSAEGGEFGYVFDNEAFPSTDGALVEFEYADWGGSGADGLTFFLLNGSTSEAEFHAGQPGGALGYASCNNPTDGLSNAYVGVGFDEYGNFTNLGSICGLDGTEFLANHVSVRGSAAESYRLLATAQTSESLRAERSHARRVTIAITPDDKLSVYVDYPDGTYQQVTEDFQLPTAPATLKFGYVASTGALTDYHEIRNAQVVKPAQLTPSITQTAGGHERGEPLTWTGVVHNEGPNATQREQLHATTGGQSLSNVHWTCEAAGGAECVTAAGTGLPNPEAGAMPTSSSLTYEITGTPTTTADYAQMTVESEPRGDTGELDPEKERATARTDLTPLFEQEPSFTLAADGKADATTASALGGDISYSYAWQRCQAGGISCIDIPGAGAPTYHTTGADMGYTIRFTQTASNSAGKTTIDSAAYQLPTTEITSAPTRYTASGEATLSFTTSASEATLECSLDGAPWSACTTPLSYQGLANGEHTFSVRALYGGLGSVDPSSAQWTVEATPPPAPTIVSAPFSPSVQADPTFQFGGLVVNDVLECQLDGSGWTPCEPTTQFTGLNVGEHELQARQVNRAGLDSGVTSYVWTIDALPASLPGPVSTPAPQPIASVAGATVTPAGLVANKTTHGRRFVGGHRGKGRQRTHQTHHGLAAKKHPQPVQHKRKATRHRHSETHKREPTRPQHAAVPRPKGKTQRPPDAPQPKPRKRRPAAKVKATTPAAHMHNKQRTPPPAVAPNDKAPTSSGAPEPKIKGNPHQHPKDKARHPETTPKSTPAPAPAPAGKPEPKTHLPATAPRGKNKAPASPGKTTKPATRRAVKHKHAARRQAAALGTKLVIRPFLPRSAALVGHARRLVRHLAATVRHARLVVCIGYTDDLGARSSNLTLGFARARTVCEKLRELGVRATFKAESRGPDQPCASNATAAGRALNRRVEVRIVS